MKINKSKDVDIYLPQNNLPTKDMGSIIKETIKNNTNNTYIIDPYGFYGQSYVSENGKILEPYMNAVQGYVSKDDRLCHELLVILKPFQTIQQSVNYNVNNRGIYKYSKGNEYFEVTNSVHNKKTVTLLGCEKYVEELESKGYKVLEDSIVAKIPLVP
ncbi:hypothetical protein LIV57_05720 [Chryseobacterium sp. X308]|uniref:hypothetical protein n=1 Tax=Chryseobacterium sp. X308 TaxID=2884873 RepID=UPI001D147FB2|nr:hypothetical protein [Chryseobacterium sp. X308]MCC3214760.1 hypothetical protein [Chryseobacterium sp. X308]